MKGLRKVGAIIVLGLVLTLCSCATSPEPYDYGAEKEIPTGPGELKEGPGLFSGEDGYFTIPGQPAATEGESAKEDKRKDQ